MTEKRIQIKDIAAYLYFTYMHVKYPFNVYFRLDSKRIFWNGISLDKYFFIV